ncbi:MULTISPECIES: RNA-directed DNA polymerase [Bacteria]|uniref:RNA-directed DNA polymerase n=1 Tax=Bacteria TaxID=2 RepID=UPI00258A4945|nr:MULTISPECIES: RNA-directed DNA polymerase [Bacteria]MCA2825969.1 RNA-directed DNA polymerase [Microcystis sp. M088S1]MCA2952300.1 RNA-directed DNA polymerase [Microcystis sp. M112S1]MCA6285353.1 RNA-directed DNA polymerase [Phenylobacterium sp.]MCA6310242.1 RNA-directed DNA polymerase [Phenylobacterium sp.]MCA6338481.1 RNA-directed DNA polymerase [Phenylobacterium sp.]
MSKSERLKALLAKGYFPDELPPAFTTVDFARYRSSIGTAWARIGRAPNTTPERFSIPKITDWRREISIVNPISQYNVSSIISDNWKIISKHINSNSFGADEIKIDKNGSRSVSNPDFRLVALRQSEISSIHNYALVADISRFYGTLYTHAIPWALHSKVWSKDNLHSRDYNSSVGAQLDRAVRSGQENQTLGIPVGPDTSRIIAEIIAVSIDSSMKSSLSLNPDSIVRNVDDWYIGFDNAGDAEEAISILSSAARYYELEIHPEKTKVLKLSNESNPVWPSSLLQIDISPQFSSQSRNLDHYFSQAFYLSKKYNNQNVLKYAINLLRNVDILRINWNQLETYLFKVARANATTIPMIVHLLALYNAKGFPLNRDRIAKFIKDTIAKCGPSAAHFEIAWTLFLAKMLRIMLPASWVQPVTRLESSICALILLDLRHIGLIDGPIDVSLWTQAMTANGLESNLWLVAYEADLKGWLTAPTANFVQRHPHFSELRRLNVSFYDMERRLKNVRLARPKGPSEAFRRRMAVLRDLNVSGLEYQHSLEEWELPNSSYDSY